MFSALTNHVTKMSAQCYPSIQLHLRTFTTTSKICGNRFYNPKIAMTMTKNATKNMQRLLTAELIKQQKETSRKGPKTSPKDPVLFDNNRTKVFNRQFMENIGDVMLGIPDLLGHGLTITKVSKYIL